MRLNRVATAFATVLAGLTAVAVVRNRADRRWSAPHVQASPVQASPVQAPPHAAPSLQAPAVDPAATAAEPVAEPATEPVAEPVEPVGTHDAVVLPFTRPEKPETAQPAATRPVPQAPAPTTSPAPEEPAAPGRCGDNGGRTKAGAPCAARAGAGGRCRHHPVAA